MKTKLLFVFAFLAFQVSFAKVVVAPIAPTISPLQYCDPNNDGFGEFDFATTTAFILSVQSGTASDYEVTYHSTLNDAENGVASLPSPYFNSRPGNQIVYYRIENVITSEYAVGNLNLNVNPTPVATTPVDLVLCDYNSDGFEIFNLSTLIPEILGGFNPSNYTVTFYHSLVSANADVGAIAPINVYTGTNGEVIYARLTNNATGCFDVVSFQLHVEAIPLAMQPNYPEYALCDLEQNGIGYETFDLGSRINTVLMGQTGMDVTFYPSLGDAQNGVAEISNLLFQNTIQYVQTLGIRITNMATGCYTLSTMDIRVNPLPNLVPPPAPYTICDTNSDGFAVFNLTTLLPDLTQGDANIIITFHETLAEAEIGGMSIAAPSFYNNITPFTQTLYVRGEDPETGCVSIIPINIVANPSPVTPILLDSIMVCDSDSNPQSASTLFNLTIAIPDILAQQPLPSSNYTVTFYNSLVSASSGISAIIPSTNYFGTNGETVWCRVEANATGCYAVGSFQLIVNTPLSLTTPTPLAVCDDDGSPNNQYTTFDLTVKDAEITQGQPSYVVTYYPSLALAQVGNSAMAIPNPTAYANTISAIQTLGVQVTSPFGCKSVTTLDIRVLPVPTPNVNPPALFPQCDVNYTGDMLETFDLTVNQAFMTNGDPSLVFHYFRTSSDAVSNTNEILTPTAAVVGGNVWIRVENTRIDFFGNNCYVLVEQPLTVNPLPTVVQPLPPYRMCDDNSDGIATFDLTNPLLAQMILGPSQLPTNYTISYYLSAAGANPFTNTGEMPLPASFTNVTSYIQSIYIRVVNNFTGCVNATGLLDLVVEQQALASAPLFYATCDDDGNPYDGVVGVDLNQFTTTVLVGQNPSIFLISYYVVDPTINTGALPLTATDIANYEAGPGTDTVWVKVENSSNSITPFCYAITTINIIVEREPNPVITTNNGLSTVYVNAINGAVVQSLLLDSSVTGNYIYEWYLNGIVVGTSSTYSVDTATPNNESRSYSVRVINNSSLGCSAISLNFVVFQSDSIPPPSGLISQTLPGGSTLANIMVSGTNVQWYSTATNRNQTSTPLPLNTVLIDGTTYYASQTIGGIESAERLPVTVYLTLGVDNPEIFPIQYAPNPVKNNLTLQSTQVLKSVIVYTMLGQKVLEQNYNTTEAVIDLSRLSSASYILKVEGDVGQKTIRIIKE